MYWIPFILIIPYIFLTTYIFYHLRKIKRFEPSGPASIYVSVIIACRNEEKNLPEILRKLQNQNYPRDSYQVIIVDDNSVDDTSEVAKGYKGSMNISVLKNKGTGKKKAVKTGVTEAKGELIIATDADCRMEASWIATIAAFFEQARPDLIILPVRLMPLNGFFGRFQELEFLSLQGITAGAAIANNAMMCNGANLAFSKNAYLKNEKNLRYDIATGDDIFLLHSMKENHSSIRWLESNDTMVITNPAPDLKSFFRQRIRWAAKSSAYKDTFSIISGIVTFVTIFILAIFTITAFFDQKLLIVFTGLFLLKSIPDYLILRNTAKRYGRNALMKWFIISQMVYPFYVLAISIGSLFPGKKIRVAS
jgi:cellulose synthase/poly-beta-1,6-N-acetylglucosamine synthase-like glycosyltransferase